jgi:hypothetical protein
MQFNMTRTIILLSTIYNLSIYAQTGGTTSFNLLNLTYNARSAGLGNDFITAKDQDINMGIANPSLYNEKMNNCLSINQALVSGGINYGQVAYGHNLKRGFLGASIRYVNYGNFQRTEINGTSSGNFNPFECIIGAGFGKQLNPRISVGGNINLLFSQLETYSAFGLAIDLAGTYTSKDESFLLTALVKNAGYQFKGYKDNTHDPLPIEFQLAGAYKLKHAPFRFSLLVHNLNRWNLAYNDPSLQPTKDPLTGEKIPVRYEGFGENLARHFTYQVEIIISKSLHLRAAFDYQRRQELKLITQSGLAGFSFGIGMYFKKLSIEYGFSVYSRAGFNNMLTISSNLSKWKK